MGLVRACFACIWIGLATGASFSLVALVVSMYLGAALGKVLDFYRLVGSYFWISTSAALILNVASFQLEYRNAGRVLRHSQLPVALLDESTQLVVVQALNDYYYPFRFDLPKTLRQQIIFAAKHWLRYIEQLNIRTEGLSLRNVAAQDLLESSRLHPRLLAICDFFIAEGAGKPS
jgi:hypothetical protein